jgi:hypothetical protein
LDNSFVLNCLSSTELLHREKARGAARLLPEPGGRRKGKIALKISDKNGIEADGN